MNILVTGGAGFIGSALVRYLINETDHHVLNLDKLTYAGNLYSLESVVESPRYTFKQIDICDQNELECIFSDFRPQLVMHLAAESHVDRSIENPDTFIQTNIVGTYALLATAKSYFESLQDAEKSHFRFLHISTDEVYGDLADGEFFTEETPYAPSSPYSASKAASDHLVQAWHRTYDFPVVITNCSNNYGPYQFPEKLIPLMIINAMSGKHLPVYGDGKQVRDWLFVDDHVKALMVVAEKGKLGETYNIGGHNEKANIDVVKLICTHLESLTPDKTSKVSLFDTLIQYVTDRPGHDTRYAIDASKIQRELGWKPTETFESGMKKTVQWYQENTDWWQRILNNTYQDKVAN